MKQELEKYNSTYSAERLTAFAYSATDKFDDIVNNYSNNNKNSSSNVSRIMCFRGDFKKFHL